ncbi:MAG TPA: DinB family protein [Chloroflexota bacterium]
MAETCAECSFDWATSTLEGLRIVHRLPEDAREMVEPMGEGAYRRPQPDVWSANEYIWHLVDAFRMAAEWMHDMRVTEHPTHYAVDNDALAAARRYDRLPVHIGLWSLEQSCRLFIEEAAVTDPDRTCYYHDWQDVTAAQVVGFLAHEAAHHLYDLRRARGG